MYGMSLQQLMGSGEVTVIATRFHLMVRYQKESSFSLRRQRMKSPDMFWPTFSVCVHGCTDLGLRPVVARFVGLFQFGQMCVTLVDQVGVCDIDTPTRIYEGTSIFIFLHVQRDLSSRGLNYSQSAHAH